MACNIKVPFFNVLPVRVCTGYVILGCGWVVCFCFCGVIFVWVLGFAVVFDAVFYVR